MDIWKHGKYLDMWSTVHFLSGYSLGGLFYWLGANFILALALSTVLIIMWEMFEAATKIIEPSLNVGIDIVIGLAGFFIAAWLFYGQIFNFNLPLFVTIVALTLLLALWGFVDFLLRGYR